MGIVSESNNLGEGDNPECQFRRFQTLSRFTRWMEIEEGACRIRNVDWSPGLRLLSHVVDITTTNLVSALYYLQD